MRRAREQSVTPITDPASISPQTVYDFSANPEGSSPGNFPDGTFQGVGHVELVGQGWATWNPQIAGKHVLFATEGGYQIDFTSPQQAVGVVAEPNVFDVFPITIEAFDASFASLGSFSLPIHGNAGASFLGLGSSTANIATVQVTTPPEADGFAFSDLTYGSFAQGPPIFLFVHGWNAAADDIGYDALFDGLEGYVAENRIRSFQHYQDAEFQQVDGSCLLPRPLILPQEPNGGMPVDLDSVSDAICDSQGDAGLNAVALHDEVRQLSEENGNAKVVILTTSGGAAIVRGFLAYSSELGDNMWSLVDSVFFLEGAHDGAWGADELAAGLDALAFLGEFIADPPPNEALQLDLSRPLLEDVVPQSDWYSWTNPGEARLPELPYYNAYAAIDVVLELCPIFADCFEAGRDKFGDFVMLEGTDPPFDVPPEGGARFLPGSGGETTWQWRLGDEFKANGLLGVPGAYTDAFNHPATHFNLNPRFAEIQTSDCATGASVSLLDQLLTIIKGRMDGEPAECQP